VPAQDQVGRDAIDATTGEVMPGVLWEPPARKVFQARVDRVDMEGSSHGIEH